MAYGEKLIAYLGLDTAGFKAGIAGAESALSSFAGKIGLGLSVAGLTAYTRDVIAYGSTIQDLSERFNVSTTALQQFGNAGELVGTSLEGVAKGFNKLEISQSKALGGNKGIISAFKNLGISLEDLQTLKPDQLMQKLGASSLNAADLVAVLGKNALELRPLLKGLGDGTLELGSAIDKNLIQQLDRADDRFKTFQQRVKIATASTGGDIMEFVRSIGSLGQRMGDELSGGSASGLSAMRSILRGNFAAARDELKELAKSGQQAIKELFSPLQSQSGARIEGGASMTGGVSEAETKALQRELLSLKDLTDGGARYGRPATEQGWHGWLGGGMATGTAQAIYNAEQARKARDLEAQAKEVQLTGISSTGETAHQLYGRAAEARESIGTLKDSEKQIGTWVIDDSSTGKAVQQILQEFQSGGDE